MIEFHRPDNDPFSDRIEEWLKDLVVSHKIHRYDGEKEDSTLYEQPPFIRENEKVVEGKENIERYIRDLEGELRQQRMVTGDSCYIDPETGEVC